jgi:integrase
MLTDNVIKKAKIKEKRYMLSDSDGLYLEIMPSGKKYWRLRYWIDGKEYKHSIGQYPAVGLKEAREIRDEMKASVMRSGQPVSKLVDKTFEAVAQDWLQKKVFPIRTKNHIRTVTSRLDRLILPYIGQKLMSEISPTDILAIIRMIEARGTYETAHRVLQICSQIFRYGIAIGMAERDIAADLRGALVPVKTAGYPTITDPQEIGALMRAIRGLNGSEIVRSALLVLAYTFVRPGELRTAEWEEVSLEAAEWRIPAEKMKMKRMHIVPLSRQAVSVLASLRPFTSSSRFVFPSARSFSRSMSDTTVNAALRRLGYGQEDFTGHGFRSMASTILNENGWPADVIERQLAHVEKNAVRAAYNHAEYLDQRREMMQWWADWLDEKMQIVQ